MTPVAAGTGVIAITPRETGQVPPPNGGEQGEVALDPVAGEGVAVLPMYGNRDSSATVCTAGAAVVSARRRFVPVR